MRNTYLVLLFMIASGCKPGEVIRSPSSKQDKVTSPIGSDAIPSSSTPQQPSPPDPEEEVKAAEPAIIGGAYLYCDADEEKAGPGAKPSMAVACRLGNVGNTDWAMADKQAQVINKLDGTIMDVNMVMTIPGSPYHMLFSGDRSLMGAMELQLSVALPQGSIEFGSTLSRFDPTLATLRQSKGLTFAASVPSAKELPVTDRKTWNRWMPVKIPKAISNVVPVGSGKGAASLGHIELSFDDTVCTYRNKDAAKAKEPAAALLDGEGDLEFVSCTKPSWVPELWVRSKSMSVTIPQNPANTGAVAIGLVLETSP